jgi:2-keto-4-pentenoate hydratase
MAMEKDFDLTARRLREAYAASPIAPLRDVLDPTDIDGAYAVQAINTAHWVGEGRRLVGRKIGLTAKAVQTQLGVDQPDFGALFADMRIADGGRLDPARAIQPKAEAEIAFVLGRDIADPDAPIDAIGTAIDHVVAAIEIVDSRIADWKIKLIDTIADNASYGGFTLGPWSADLAKQDLAALALGIRHNGILAAEGLGSAALGHPAKSTAWLANKLLELGVSLEPGNVVISGGVTKMLPVKAGDVFVFSLTGQPDLEVRFR